MRIVIVAVLGLLLTACTWVKLDAAGEKVRVLTAQEVGGCKELGKTHAMLRSTVAGVERNEEKVKSELETLARNAAGGMGGDTVVPASEITDGKQTFMVYRCMPSAM